MHVDMKLGLLVLLNLKRKNEIVRIMNARK